MLLEEPVENKMSATQNASIQKTLIEWLLFESIVLWTNKARIFTFIRLLLLASYILLEDKCNIYF